MSQILIPYCDVPFEYDKDFYQDYGIFVKPIDYPLSSRKIESLLEIAEMQKFFQCNPVKFIDIMFNIELLDMQALAVQKTWICPNSLLVCTRGFGKALALDTRIPTPSGNRTIKDIQVGDYVFDENGIKTKVINTSPIFVNHDCYEMQFSDGEIIVADADHLWSVYNRYSRHPKDLEVRNTRWLYEHFEIPPRKSTKNWNPSWKEHKFSVPIAKPIEFEEAELPVHPYILGLWLGDGKSDDGYITVSTADLDELCDNIVKVGYKVHSIINDSGDNKRVRVHSDDDIPLITLLRKINVCGNKHIPHCYLTSSVDQRLNLLQGLMDTDGSVSKDGACEFTQSRCHDDVLTGFEDLLNSLCIKYKKYDKEIKQWNKVFLAQRFYFISSKEFPCFKMKRKYDRLRDALHPMHKKKQIVSITKVNSVPTKCLMVDSSNHLFLCGNHNTVTHNSTVIDLELMSKGMLFNNYWCYIASGSGSQAENTFNTLEKLANDNIDTFAGSTGRVFKNEVEIKNAAGDGFSHSSNGFNYSLYNGSMTATLNSNIDAKRGEMLVDIKFTSFFIIQRKRYNNTDYPTS